MDSSDIVQMLVLTENSFLRVQRKPTTRRKYGVHPINKVRRRYGEYHHLFRSLREDRTKFFEYTRISMETYDYILGRVKHHLEKKRVSLQQQVTPEERLVVTMRFLATGVSFRHLAFEFRLGRITVSYIVFETCKALRLEFLCDVLPVPTEEHLRQVAERFYTLWDFPNCIGAIDGKHCQMKCPPMSGSSYYNYLKYFSIVLMAVVDADKRFLVIEVGSRGKQSDGGIFVASELFRRLSQNQFNVPPPKNLPGTHFKVPHVLVGDEAFPLLPYLMRPYPEKVPSPPREVFNARLSRARKTVECAFGILRAKWRIFSKDIEISSVKKASTLIQTACILHNIIRDRDGMNDPDYIAINRELVEEQRHFDTIPDGFRNAPVAAKVVREQFTRFFNQ